MLFESLSLSERAAAAVAPPVERRRPQSWFVTDSLSLLLDQIDYGLIVVDAASELRYANHAAHEAMAVDHPLEIRDGGLRARCRDDAASLGKALKSSTRGLRSLLVLGTGETRACVAVVPLQGTGTGEVHETLVVLGKRSVWGELSAQWYARTHGLTSAETQVLNLLCVGAPPVDIARQLGVAVSTVRSQIGSIRSKTGAHSIGAVLRKIAMLPPLVCTVQRGVSPSALAHGA